MDLIDLVRIGFRRWYIAVPAAALALLAAFTVRSSVEVQYRSSGSLLIYAPKEPDSTKNRLLGFNSLSVPATVASEVVMTREIRERLVSQGAAENYQVGLDPSNPAPLVIAVATGGFEQAPRTVELVLNEVDAELKRRQEALGAPPETWITAEVVTPPSDNPAPETGSRTRAFLGVLFLGAAATAALTLIADRILDRKRRPGPPLEGGDRDVMPRPRALTPGPDVASGEEDEPMPSRDRPPTPVATILPHERLPQHGRREEAADGVPAGAGRPRTVSGADDEAEPWSVLAGGKTSHPRMHPYLVKQDESPAAGRDTSPPAQNQD